MADSDLFDVFDISASGLNAERVRLSVVANNLANAETTQTPEGGPYRRRQVVFASVLGRLKGVEVSGVVASSAPPRMVYNPGHPDADEKGFVAMPDIKVPMEMMDLLTASRAYEANLAVMHNFKRICEETIKLLR
jgi:flagellar basal-body rod protein FlgC